MTDLTYEQARRLASVDFLHDVMRADDTSFYGPEAEPPGRASAEAFYDAVREADPSSGAVDRLLRIALGRAYVEPPSAAQRFAAALAEAEHKLLYGETGNYPTEPDWATAEDFEAWFGEPVQFVPYVARKPKPKKRRKR